MLRPPHVRAHQSFCMFAMSIKVAGAGQNVYVVVSQWMTTHETFHLKYFPFDRFRVRPASVNLQKGFQRLRNPENSQKQPKTNETWNPGNLCWGPAFPAKICRYLVVFVPCQSHFLERDIDSNGRPVGNTNINHIKKGIDI